MKDIWINARRMGIVLPQDTPVTASAMCQARSKVRPTIFKELHQEILQRFKAERDVSWKNRRVFAVDETMIDLPRSFLKKGYQTFNNTPDPQGLISCLYELIPCLPIDFALSSHGNKRMMAVDHLSVLSAQDVVMYDHKYFSYTMLLEHVMRGFDVVFRFKSNANADIAAFLASDRDDKVIDIAPDPTARTQLALRYPNAIFQPLPLRLVRSTIGSTAFVLGTTLRAADGFFMAELSELFHHCWGIDKKSEAQKIFMTSKNVTRHSVHGILQELYANFVLVTVVRLMTKDGAADINDSRVPQWTVPQRMNGNVHS